jgi:predicted alpha/beta-hydrolase family hydrolase
VQTKELTLRISDRIGDVAALLQRPRGARWLLVLAHGAGAGMRHPFMEDLARELADVGVATLRYQFPYIQQGRSSPNPPAVLIATVRAALSLAKEVAPDLRLLAGGKSLGGRMTSQTMAERPGSGSSDALSRVRGLVFFGFPLHAPGKPSATRAAHLEQVKPPMLFFQGTRATLAELSRVRRLCAELGPRATLHVLETADHSFHVLKRSGATDADALRDLAKTTASWADSLPG